LILSETLKNTLI